MHYTILPCRKIDSFSLACLAVLPHFIQALRIPVIILTSFDC